MKMALIMLIVFVVGAGTGAGAYHMLDRSQAVSKAPVTAISDPDPNAVLIEAAMSVVRQNMRDPESVRFRNVEVADSHPTRWLICGEFNAANGFGGYVGFQPFIVGEFMTSIGDGDDIMTIYNNWTLFCPSAFPL